MNTNEIIEKLNVELSNIATLNDLNELRINYMGKKGIITELQSKIKDIPNEEKKEYGKKINEVKTIFLEKFEEVKTKLEESVKENYKDAKRVVSYKDIKYNKLLARLERFLV